MFTAYGVFFAALAISLGRDLGAAMMIVISAGYALMYFGTATIINRVDAAARPQAAPKIFDTLSGKLSYGAAFAQMLTVPILLAGFAIYVAIICSVVK